MNTLFIGQNLINLKSVDSTNTFLLNLSNNEKIVEGTVVHAENQIKGRGQRNNSWISEGGKSLCFSVLFYPKLDLSHQFTFNKCIALALVSSLNVLGLKSFIKWPNDIFVNDKKIAGLLIENSIREKKLQKSIVGIGINANNNCSEIESATSLKEVLNADINLKELLSILCQELEKYYLLFRNDKKQIQDSYHSYLYKKNCLVKFTKEGNQFSAIVKEVDDFGRLILIEKGVEKVYSVGELSFNLF
jgi:BirA family biotin operon repressor/biotin-[acetyl-CoA-carboxylase] ligase